MSIVAMTELAGLKPQHFLWEVKDRIAAYNARRGHAERLAKLFGLDAVVKAEVEHSGIQNIVLDPRVLGIQDTPSNDR